MKTNTTLMAGRFAWFDLIRAGLRTGALLGCLLISFSSQALAEPEVTADARDLPARQVSETVAVDEATVNAERKALFEAERDAMFGKADLTAQAIAERRAKFWADNIERITRQRERERALGAIKRAQHKQTKSEVVASPTGSDGAMDTNPEATVLRRLDAHDVEAALLKQKEIGK